MAQDPFDREIKDIDQEQRAFVLKALGLPLPQSLAIKNSWPKKKTARLSNGISALFNGTLLSTATLAVALQTGIIAKETLDISKYGICEHYVTDEGVNLRTGPGTNFESKIKLKKEENINIIGYTLDANNRDYMWAQITVLDEGKNTVYYVREDNIQSRIIPSLCRTLQR